MRVLELFCGLGGWSKPWIESGHDVTGIDIKDYGYPARFIKADIIPYPEFVSASGWVKAREQGKVQSMGRDYVMKDGDVVEFKLGV